MVYLFIIYLFWGGGGGIFWFTADGHIVDGIVYWNLCTIKSRKPRDFPFYLIFFSSRTSSSTLARKFWDLSVGKKYKRNEVAENVSAAKKWLGWVLKDEESKVQILCMGSQAEPITNKGKAGFYYFQNS